MLTPHFFLLLLNVAVNLPNASPATPEVARKSPTPSAPIVQVQNYRQSRCRCWRGSGRREILTFDAGRLENEQERAYPIPIVSVLELL